MTCKNCGSPLTEGQKFCNACGTPCDVVQPTTQAAPVEQVPVASVTPAAPVTPVVEAAPVAPETVAAPVTPEVTPAPAPVAPETPVAAPVTPEVTPAPAAPVAPAAPEAPIAAPGPVPVQQPTTVVPPVAPATNVVPPVASAQPEQPKKKDSNILFILIVLLSVVVLVFLGKMLLENNSGSKDDKKTTTTTTKETTTSTTTTSTTTTTTIAQVATGEYVTLYGYKFLVPEGFTSEVTDNAVSFINYTTRQLAMATLYGQTLDSFKAAYPTFKANNEAAGATNIVMSEGTYNGQPYATISYNAGGYAYADYYIEVEPGVLLQACVLLVNGTDDGSNKQLVFKIYDGIELPTASFAGTTITGDVSLLKPTSPFTA